MSDIASIPSPDSVVNDDTDPQQFSSSNNVCPFEGPEKLLEIWFLPSAGSPSPADTPNGKTGLRSIDRSIWEEVLDIVKCKVLNVIQGNQVDAYLLRWSSQLLCP